jgi:hypothetical protein
VRAASSRGPYRSRRGRHGAKPARARGSAAMVSSTPCILQHDACSMHHAASIAPGGRRRCSARQPTPGVPRSTYLPNTEGRRRAEEAHDAPAVGRERMHRALDGRAHRRLTNLPAQRGAAERPRPRTRLPRCDGRWGCVARPHRTRLRSARRRGRPCGPASGLTCDCAKSPGSPSSRRSSVARAAPSSMRHDGDGMKGSSTSGTTSIGGRSSGAAAPLARSKKWSFVS